MTPHDSPASSQLDDLARSIAVVITPNRRSKGETCDRMITRVSFLIMSDEQSGENAEIRGFRAARLTVHSVRFIRRAREGTAKCAFSGAAAFSDNNARGFRVATLERAGGPSRARDVFRSAFEALEGLREGRRAFARALGPEPSASRVTGKISREA